MCGFCSGDLLAGIIRQNQARNVLDMIPLCHVISAVPILCIKYIGWNLCLLRVLLNGFLHPFTGRAVFPVEE